MSKIRVTRISSNALLPTRAHGAALGYDISTLYHTALPSGRGAALTTGLIFVKRDDRIAFVFGRLPTAEHNRIDILQHFVEMGN
jgi:dUTPase